MSSQDVFVKVSSFSNFFEKDAAYPIGIDSYQRPFVWGTDKIQELISDLKEYCEDPKGLPYYMGIVLLHQNDDKRKLFIIDGQQRLTSLCVLYYCLIGKLPGNGIAAMQYHSPHSAKNIQSARNQFLSAMGYFEKNAEQLFENIEITFIITKSEDLAFTFFDTQNNRGVKLGATDLLKAYHLRAIGNNSRLPVQENCASRWETIQKNQPVFGFSKDFTSELFGSFLWRARCWREHNLKREEDDDILHEFQKKTLPCESPERVPLYPNTFNVFANTLEFKDGARYALIPNSIEMGEGNAHLPFSLRQPLHSGLGFFMYAEKYAALVSLLFVDSGKSDEILAFRKFYQDVWQHVNLYLKELFTLAMIVYYDKFRDKNLLEYSLWLDHILGALRLEKYYIFKESPLKFLREIRLIDAISWSYLPDEIISFLKSKSNTSIYTSGDVELGKGVRGQYKKAVMNYYGNNNWSSKEQWISKEFLCRKLQTRA